MKPAGIFPRPNFILMVTALVLGILAAVAGNPEPAAGRTGTWIETDRIGGQTVQTMDVHELASWIMEKKKGFLLLDCRPADAFNRYHLPGSRRFDTEISGNDLPAAAPVVAATADGSMEPGTWKQLRERYGDRLVLLRGGMKKWAARVLFPDLTRKSGLSVDEIRRRKRVSLFFGGRPRLSPEAGRNRGLIYLREGC